MELTITEAATLLGRSPRTVRAQVARGELPGFKRGGQWVIRREALPLSEAQRAALARNPRMFVVGQSPLPQAVAAWRVRNPLATVEEVLDKTYGRCEGRAAG